MNDDLDAIPRVLAADVESFRRLVERYQRPLLTLIRNLTAPDTDDERVAQEVFLAAFRSLASFDPKRSAFSTWLFTVAHNRCRNELARRRDFGSNLTTPFITSWRGALPGKNRSR
jgi:RNA polymerase sigma-70 factor, ECF subfamily